MDDKSNWECTDPNNRQYGKKLGDGVYEFREFNRFGYYVNTADYHSEEIFINAIWDNSEFWVEAYINLRHYTEKEIWNHVCAYYRSMEEVYTIYKEEAEWVIAECIFEQESGLY